ncbi:hypothetical protein GW17_00044087 [Ensete ventricosum]|nr:hypothetical protein GW17_00044087 [Ensete ventricosum]
MWPCCSPPHDTAPLRSTWGIRGGSSVSTLNHSLPSTHRSTRPLAQWPDSSVQQMEGTAEVCRADVRLRWGWWCANRGEGSHMTPPATRQIRRRLFSLPLSLLWLGLFEGGQHASLLSPVLSVLLLGSARR